MTDPTDPQAIIDSIEQQTPTDADPLADDLDASIQALSDQIELSSNNQLGISPEQGLAMLRPMIRAKTSSEPSTTLRTLAIIHLETGALLDKHSDTDPVELI